MIRHSLALAVGSLLTASAVAQPPADHTPSRSRRFTLPIEFAPEKRKTIQRVELLVSRDNGQTWGVEDAVTPDKDHFNLNAKDDGTYWLSMMIHHMDGTTDPQHVTKLTPDRVLKYLIDATPPVVRLTHVTRDGDEVALEWAVEDNNPNDPATAVSYKGATGEWKPVPADAMSKRTARFKPSVAGPLTVRVSVQDSTGNTAQVMKDLAGGTTAGYTPPIVPAAANQSGGLGTPQLPAPVLPGGSPAPAFPSTPSGPSVPGPVMPAAPIVAAPVTPAVTTPAAPAPLPPAAPTPITPAPTGTAPTWNPPPAATTPDASPPPIAVSGGTTSPTFSPASTPAPAQPEASSVQHIRFTQFQLQYQLDAGPSGVRQIDLYVTRDDGRTWTRWSQHDGKENPLRVNLAGRGVGPVDGDYGFKMVSVSGANLSDDIPTPGTAPDVRVRVDTTPPLISVFAIEADQANRNAVLVKWKATDLNLTESSPIGIDWSDSPAGPWRPVGGSDPSSVNPNPATAGKVPNRGVYSWPLPANLPNHLVYFRFTATDPAGNRSEVVAPPQTVDLHRPRARIQSVVTATVPR